MVFVNSAGEIVFIAVRSDSGSEMEIPDDLRGQLNGESLFDLPTKDSTVTGVVLQPMGLLVARDLFWIVSRSRKRHARLRPVSE
jgi:hypothetical protein